MRKHVRNKRWLFGTWMFAKWRQASLRCRSGADSRRRAAGGIKILELEKQRQNLHEDYTRLELAEGAIFRYVRPVKASTRERRFSWRPLDACNKSAKIQHGWWYATRTATQKAKEAAEKLDNSDRRSHALASACRCEDAPSSCRHSVAHNLHALARTCICTDAFSIPLFIRVRRLRDPLPSLGITSTGVPRVASIPHPSTPPLHESRNLRMVQLPHMHV